MSNNFEAFNHELDKATTQGGVVKGALPDNLKEERNPSKFTREKQHVLKKKEWREAENPGHFSDKHSGMMRENKPRKAGGGRNNIGNLKDIIEAEKYDLDEAEFEARYGKRRGENVAEDEANKPTLD